ncbi:MAG: NAD(P)-dependent oxidoreductase [Acidobacteria bacterium]|jgi:nucleoside-diphosphate-sugar epimerase|nr:NAD(P)-dependent oxidoreductase [Acidobacteriota bacterium]
MSLPSIIVTGASGFIGRFLLESLKEEFLIYGIARRSQARSGAPVHPNIKWYQVDIGDVAPLRAVFHRIRDKGGADTVIHLAAHYDFSGEEHPEYIRTNIDGHRNLLECCREAGIRNFVFSSSVAASRLPPRGEVLDETSAPDGDHIYARTKRIGEEMLEQYRHEFRSVIVRFAALFSGWCEYPPLFMFLNTWLSGAWNARVLGGRGETSIPFLHVRDAVFLLRRVIDRLPEFEQGEVLVASPDGATSHLELFRAATRAWYGKPRTPVFMPKLLCGPGMWVMDSAGKLTGERPFERPWMARYIDTQMTIDASRTRQRLGWEPRQRLSILTRMPFLIENLKTDPIEWNRRNRAALKQAEVRDNLRIYWLLVKHGEQIQAEFFDRIYGPEGQVRFPSYQHMDTEDHRWALQMLLRQVLHAIRTGDRAILAEYCRDIAERRYHEGFSADEVCGALQLLNQISLKVLRKDRETEGMFRQLREQITMPLRWGCDQAQDRFEQLEEGRVRRGEPRPMVRTD